MCIVILRLQTKLTCCESLCVLIFFPFSSYFPFLLLYFFNSFFSLFLVLYEREVKKVWFTLSICCQVAKVHIALLFSVYVHSLKKKKIIEMALKTKQNTSIL